MGGIVECFFEDFLNFVKFFLFTISKSPYFEKNVWEINKTVQFVKNWSFKKGIFDNYCYMPESNFIEKIFPFTTLFSVGSYKKH